MKFLNTHLMVLCTKARLYVPSNGKYSLALILYLAWDRGIIAIHELTPMGVLYFYDQLQGMKSPGDCLGYYENNSQPCKVCKASKRCFFLSKIPSRESLASKLFPVLDQEEHDQFTRLPWNQLNIMDTINGLIKEVLLLSDNETVDNVLGDTTDKVLGNALSKVSRSDALALCKHISDSLCEIKEHLNKTDHFISQYREMLLGLNKTEPENVSKALSVFCDLNAVREDVENENYASYDKIFQQLSLHQSQQGYVNVEQWSVIRTIPNCYINHYLKQQQQHYVPTDNRETLLSRLRKHFCFMK